jgi:hypothetical protein
MEDKNEKPKSDISVTTWVLALLACLIFDAISLIPLAGDAEDVPAGVVLIVSIILGVGPAINIIQGIVIFLKLFPAIQEWPWWTTGWLAAVIIELISKIVPVIKPALQVAEKAAEVKSGNVGELKEGAAAAKGAATVESVTAESVVKGEAGTGATTAEGAGAQEGVTREGVGGDEAPQTPPGEESSPLDEEGGNAMKNLREGLLEPAPEEGEPQAALPYQKDAPRQKDNIVEFPGPKGSSSQQKDGLKGGDNVTEFPKPQKGLDEAA